jgi:hypothetical protein
MHQLFLDDVPKLEADTLRHELQQIITKGKPPALPGDS